MIYDYEITVMIGHFSTLAIKSESRKIDEKIPKYVTNATLRREIYFL